MTAQGEERPAGAGEEGAAPVPWRAVGTVVALIAVFAATLGLTYPLLTLILEARGTAQATIGLNAAMTPLGILLGSLAAPAVARLVGPWRLMVVSLLATVALLGLLGLLQSLPAWYLLRFLLGLFNAFLFIVSETWINRLAPPARRGRVVALYTTCTAAGFGLGPLALPFTGIETFLPFALGMAGTGAALLPLLLWRAELPAERAPAGHVGVLSLLRFLPLAPVLLAAVAVASFAEAVMLALYPVYALDAGYSRDATAIALSVTIAGTALLQLPLGWLADRLPRRLVLAGCAFAAVAGLALLGPALGTPLLWPLLFLLGGAFFGVYTLALTRLGERFSGGLLLVGNACFGLAWGFGGMLGPAATGAVMDLAGTASFPWVPALAFLLLGFAALGDRR